MITSVKTKPRPLSFFAEEESHDKDGMPGKWVTVHGHRIFIRDGETMADAFKRHAKTLPARVATTIRVSTDPHGRRYWTDHGKRYLVDETDVVSSGGKSYLARGAKRIAWKDFERPAASIVPEPTMPSEDPETTALRIRFEDLATKGADIGLSAADAVWTTYVSHTASWLSSLKDGLPDGISESDARGIISHSLDDMKNVIDAKSAIRPQSGPVSASLDSMKLSEVNAFLRDYGADSASSMMKVKIAAIDDAIRVDGETGTFYRVTGSGVRKSKIDDAAADGATRRDPTFISCCKNIDDAIGDAFRGDYITKVVGARGIKTADDGWIMARSTPIVFDPDSEELDSAEVKLYTAIVVDDKSIKPSAATLAPAIDDRPISKIRVRTHADGRYFVVEHGKKSLVDPKDIGVVDGVKYIRKGGRRTPWVEAAGESTSVVAPVATPPLTISPDEPYQDAAPTPLADRTADNVMATKTGEAKGSNPGGQYEGKDGVRRYVKFYSDPAQAACEVVANDIYRALGMAAPESFTFATPDGKTAYASRIIDGTSISPSRFSPAKEEDAKELFKGIAADILLKNWDVVGTSRSNLLKTPNGHIARLDSGGSLLFRAKNGRKKDTELEDMSETEKFFDPSYNPAYAERADLAEYKSIADVPDFEEQALKVKVFVDGLKSASGGLIEFLQSRGLKGADALKVERMISSRADLVASVVEKARKAKADAAAKAVADRRLAEATRAEAVERARKREEDIAAGIRPRLEVSMWPEDSAKVKASRKRFVDKIVPAVAANLKRADVLPEGTSNKEVLDWLQTKTEEIMPKLNVFKRMYADDLISALGHRDKRIKTQFEIEHSDGSYDPTARADKEHALWGHTRGIATTPELRPVYGYLDPTEDGAAQDASWYGDIRVKYKDNVRPRVTYTTTDSLGMSGWESSYGSPTAPLEEPRAEVLPKGHGRGPEDDLLQALITGNAATFQKSWPGYIEAQVWGSVHIARDIERVYIPRNAKKKKYAVDGSLATSGGLKTITDGLDKLGVPWTIVDN